MPNIVCPPVFYVVGIYTPAYAHGQERSLLDLVIIFSCLLFIRTFFELPVNNKQSILNVKKFWPHKNLMYKHIMFSKIDVYKKTINCLFGTRTP